MPPELKLISEFTADEIKRLIAKFGRVTKAEAEAVVNDPASPMIDIYLANVYLVGAKMGDMGRLAFLLDRALGKQVAEKESGSELGGPIGVAYVPKTFREKQIA